MQPCAHCGSLRSERLQPFGGVMHCLDERGCRQRQLRAEQGPPEPASWTERLDALDQRIGDAEVRLRATERRLDGYGARKVRARQRDAARTSERLLRLKSALRARGTMTRNDVYELYARNLTGAEAAALVAAAVAEGWASESVVRNGPGRPARVVAWAG